MHPTAANPTANRHPEHDMESVVTVTTSSLLLGALYWYLNFRPIRIEKFCRTDSANLFFKMRRSDRNEMNVILADPASTLNLKAFAAACTALTELIRKADKDGVWSEPAVQS